VGGVILASDVGSLLETPPLLTILHSYVEVDPMPMQVARFTQKKVSIYIVVHKNVIVH
jgi:hypothetical protein